MTIFEKWAMKIGNLLLAFTLILSQGVIMPQVSWADDPLKAPATTAPVSQPMTDGTTSTTGTTSNLPPSGSIVGIGNTLMAPDIDVEGLKKGKSQSFGSNKRVALTDNGKGVFALSLQVMIPPPKPVRGRPAPAPTYREQDKFLIKASDIVSLKETNSSDDTNEIQFTTSDGQRVTLTLGDDGVVKEELFRTTSNGSREITRTVGKGTSDRAVTIEDVLIAGNKTTEKTYDMKGKLTETVETVSAKAKNGEEVKVISELAAGAKIPLTTIKASDGDVLYQAMVKTPSIMPDKDGNLFVKAVTDSKDNVIVQIGGDKGEEEAKIFRQVIDPPKPAPKPGTKPQVAPPQPPAPAIMVNGRSIKVEEWVNPEKDTWKMPVTKYADELIRKITDQAIADMGGAMPIEGFGPIYGEKSSLPGALAADYDGAKDITGAVYKFDAADGGLRLVTPEIKPVQTEDGMQVMMWSSGRGSLSQEGFYKFIENASRRLRIPLTSEEQVSRLFDALRHPPIFKIPELTAPETAPQLTVVTILPITKDGNPQMTVADIAPISTAPVSDATKTAPVSTAPVSIKCDGLACNNSTLPALNLVPLPAGSSTWTEEQKRAYREMYQTV